MKPDNISGNMANPQSWNKYSYVIGNPVNMNDPTGHWYSTGPRDSGGGYAEDMFNPQFDASWVGARGTYTVNEMGSQGIIGARSITAGIEGKQEESYSAGGLFSVEPFVFHYPVSDEKALTAMAFSEARDYTNASVFFAIESIALNRTASGLNFGGTGAYAPLVTQIYARKQFQGVGNDQFNAALQGPAAVMALKHADFRTLQSYFLAMGVARSAVRTGIPDPTGGAIWMFSGQRPKNATTNVVSIESQGMPTWWFWH